MMLYKYEGQGINVAKKEKLILLSKANNEWWLVRTAEGVENFVPANYTKEIEPKIVQVRGNCDLWYRRAGRIGTCWANWGLRDKI